MPITEIVRVLATAERDGVRFELLYDVDGRMQPDEQTRGWPQFWLRELVGTELRATHGPFATEDDAMDAAEAAGVSGWS